MIKILYTHTKPLSRETPLSNKKPIKCFKKRYIKENSGGKGRQTDIHFRRHLAAGAVNYTKYATSG